MKKTKTSKRPLLTQAKHHAKLAVVPHKANQFRPHAVRWYGIVAILVVTGLTTLVSLHLSGGSVLGVEASMTSTSLLNDTNAQRSADKEQPLVYNEKLSAAAYMKAQDMFKQQYWAHTAPNGTTPWAWFAKVGYDYSYAGENLAKNFTTAGATVAAWMASPTHRANILNAHYTDVGFAVVDGVLDGKQTTLIVALYGQPASAVAGATTVSDTTTTTLAPATEQLSLVARFGVALQSMTPAVLGSVILLLGAAVVALGAQAYRRQLPKVLQRSWRYHHGLYKAVGLTSVAVMIITLYSGGQI